MKVLKILISVVAIATLSYMGYQKLQSNKAVIDQKATQKEIEISEIPVTAISVKAIILDDDLELIGTFEARKELTIIAESQGRITELNIAEGQFVSKGQTIASIDDATILSQLASAEAALQKARKDVERYTNLLEVGAISQTQYEEVRLGMQNQETTVTSIKQKLQYTSAKSPMSGIVKEIMLEEGSFANPGTEIATVVDISKLNMIVRVDEKNIVKVKKGQLVEIQTEVYPDNKFTGRITNIAVQADAARKYEIGIELTNNKQLPLKAGMYGTAKIPISNGGKKESLIIPRKSVVGSLKQPQVYIVNNGLAHLIDVEVGQSIEEDVIILSGLNSGDQIITSGQINLDNGKAVKVIADQSLSVNKI